MNPLDRKRQDVTPVVIDQLDEMHRARVLGFIDNPETIELMQTDAGVKKVFFSAGWVEALLASFNDLYQIPESGYGRVVELLQGGQIEPPSIEWFAARDPRVRELYAKGEDLSWLQPHWVVTETFKWLRNWKQFVDSAAAYGIKVHQRLLRESINDSLREIGARRYDCAIIINEAADTCDLWYEGVHASVKHGIGVEYIAPSLLRPGKNRTPLDLDNIVRGDPCVNVEDRKGTLESAQIDPDRPNAKDAVVPFVHDNGDDEPSEGAYAGFIGVTLGGAESDEDIYGVNEFENPESLAPDDRMCLKFWQAELQRLEEGPKNPDSRRAVKEARIMVNFHKNALPYKPNAKIPESGSPAHNRSNNVRNSVKGFLKKNVKPALPQMYEHLLEYLHFGAENVYTGGKMWVVLRNPSPG